MTQDSVPPIRFQLHNLPNHLAVHERQPFFAAKMKIAQLILFDSKLVQDGRVKVAEVVRVLDGVQADVVRRADDLAAFDTAAGQHSVWVQIK